MTDQQLPEVSRENLDRYLAKGWEDLQTFIKTLTPSQMTNPTDAAGWTVKDHLIHLAIWEVGIAALLEGKNRAGAMKVPANMWDIPIDELNGMIQQREKDRSLDDVLATLEANHRRLLAAIEPLTTEDLKRPYKHYDPTEDDERWVAWFIVGNTFGHYEEHIPWMTAIVDQEA